ncbi:glycosyltransferase family 4 protein [Paenibacillus ferrarius]|uniref:glycosyltransferase family 4 protein n=1 Tax=Paenibacillus ferrarius TaxID=1469647 RepID=UPI003D286E56
MDIAIVSPSPKPFAVGGIEKLMLGLYQQIDELTDHRVELFKVPTEEHGFWELLKSYETFYNLNLDHFDMIITCKYPAWMVQHRNHTIYMAHHLRGLFDTYHFLNMPTELKHTSHIEINKILEYIQDQMNMSKDLNDFFKMLNILYSNRANYSKDFFVFPGPFIRQIIHFLDKWALDPSRMKRYTSISNTVKERKDYFPNKVNVDVIYPPTTLQGLKGGEYEYFLVVGRLDSAKRVELVINAMKHVENQNAKLLIAGSGPDESRLKQIASGDARISFIGYINNEKLKELYSNALAVIYVPYDEDYGLVTIEAMHCGKPVITCKDSGGTTEFVIDGQTGLIANSDSISLAAKMNLLANNKSLAMTLGTSARESVKGINWNNCITSLLQGTSSSNYAPATAKVRKKITILSTYPVLPRKHGGQLRIFNIYKNLDHEYDITIVSLNNESKHYEKKIGDLTEVSIPMSNTHLEKEWSIEREVGIPITDIVMKKLIEFSPEYIRIAESHMKNSDILVAAQPYLFNLIEKFVGNKYIIYDSQNVEYELKKSMLPNNKTAHKLLEELYELEKKACLLSNIILTCSNEDMKNLTETYRIEAEKTILVPNGVDTSLNPYVDFLTRQKNKKELGIENENIIVFIGSWHKPNIEAVEEILKMAPSLPECKFIIMGGQCLAFKDRAAPKNVVFAGIVDEQTKLLIYSVADIAINPMLNGSGTNLKVAEYMANGVPVLSTEIGARGYEVVNREHILIIENDSFCEGIRELLGDNELRARLSSSSKKYVDKKFEWKVISNRVSKVLNKINDSVEVES